MRKTPQRLQAEKYCKKYPTMPNLTLAKKLVSDFPELYEDAEKARGMIRSIIGKKGSLNREKCDKSLYRDLSHSVSSVERQKLLGEGIFSNSKRLPKVLIIDIETLPMVCRTWNLIKAYMQPEDIIKDWCIVSWSAKWLFDHKTLGDVMTSKEAINRDDSRIVKSIWKLMNDADVVIAHNGLRFDFVKLNTRFILNGLNPPEPYQMIDTLAVVKKKGSGFSFSSNKLDYLGKLVRNKGKIETNKKLWIDCDSGDTKALKMMLEYNKEDVVLLEEVYLYLRAWIKSHPNMSLFMMDDSGRDCCANCGSDDILWNGGFYITPAGKYSTYRCNSCGAVGRSKVSALSRKQRASINLSTAR